MLCSGERVRKEKTFFYYQQNLPDVFDKGQQFTDKYTSQFHISNNLEINI